MHCSKEGVIYVSVLVPRWVAWKPRHSNWPFFANEAFSHQHARTKFATLASGLSLVMFEWSKAFVLSRSRVHRGLFSSSLPLICYPLTAQKSEKISHTKFCLIFDCWPWNLLCSKAQILDFHVYMVAYLFETEKRQIKARTHVTIYHFLVVISPQRRYCRHVDANISALSAPIAKKNTCTSKSVFTCVVCCQNQIHVRSVASCALF